VQRLRYMAWGEDRYEDGAGLTDNRYTGQREEGYGLYFYHARWYDPALGRFAQADSIIPQPGDPREWDRYGYVRNNPIIHYDPTGNWAVKDLDPDFKESRKINTYLSFYFPPVSTKALDSLQYFGGTQFALENGDLWNYDGYCRGYHCGIDFGAPWGTPVYAGVYGIVEIVNGPQNPSEYFGPYKIVITQGKYTIIYGHLNDVVNVKDGQYVTPATIIGHVGNPSGNISGGNNHLHLEVRCDNNKIINPMSFMSEYDIQKIVEVGNTLLNSTGVNMVNGLGVLEQPVIIRGGGSLWE